MRVIYLTWSYKRAWEFVLGLIITRISALQPGFRRFFPWDSLKENLPVGKLDEDITAVLKIMRESKEMEQKDMTSL